VKTPKGFSRRFFVLGHKFALRKAGDTMTELDWSDLFELQEESDTWQIIDELVCSPPPISPWPERPFADAFLWRLPEHDNWHAAACVKRQRENGLCRFLSWTEVLEIAERKAKPQEFGLKGPGVYIFVSIAQWEVIKVGIADALDQRLNQHLVKKPCGWQHSEIREYFEAIGAPWPQIIRDAQLCLVALPLVGWHRNEILIIECGLSNMLSPRIGFKHKT
jgi:hypothetical protein